LFFSDLETSVCADGECRLANIQVYWNLLGNYVGYGTHPKFPLTKFEHDPFDEDDFAKLNQLLSDSHSILERKEISDLTEKVPAKSSKNTHGDVDGVSSATKKEIKESVVAGGLYSCYTFWHLVHGDVRKKMTAYLGSIYSDSLNNYFLYSPYRDYQNHALKQLDSLGFTTHITQIAKIYKETQPMTRAYILKKMPDRLLKEQNVTQQFYGAFSMVDINTRTQLIKKVAAAYPEAVELLSKHLTEMTKNQLRFYLDFLNDHSENINQTVKDNLHSTSLSQEYTYGYLIREFLDSK